MRQRSDGYYAGLARMKQEHEDYRAEMQRSQDEMDLTGLILLVGAGITGLVLLAITILNQ